MKTLFYLLGAVFVTSFFEPQGNYQTAIVPLIALAVGAGLGALKHAQAKAQANRDRELSAEQVKYSPWTGRSNFQQWDRPNLFQNITSGAQSGLMAGYGASQFGADPNPTGTESPTPITGSGMSGQIASADLTSGLMPRSRRQTNWSLMG